jgi:hypothetical protein
MPSAKIFFCSDICKYFERPKKYGKNYWAVFKGYLDEITDKAAAPVIAKYTGKLAAVDVNTASTTFWLIESLRLDLGLASQVHP